MLLSCKNKWYIWNGWVWQSRSSRVFLHAAYVFLLHCLSAEEYIWMERFSECLDGHWVITASDLVYYLVMKCFVGCCCSTVFMLACMMDVIRDRNSFTHIHWSFGNLNCCVLSMWTGLQYQFIEVLQLGSNLYRTKWNICESAHFGIKHWKS